MRTNKQWRRALFIMLATGTFFTTMYARAQDAPNGFPGYLTSQVNEFGVNYRLEQQSIDRDGGLRYLLSGIEVPTDLSAPSFPTIPTPDGQYIITRDPSSSSKLNFYKSKGGGVGHAETPVHQATLSDSMLRGELAHNGVVSKDGKYVYFRVKSGEINKINTSDGSREIILPKPASGFFGDRADSLTLSSDGNTLYAVNGLKLFVYDVNSEKLPTEYSIIDADLDMQLTSILISPTDQEILIRASDNINTSNIGELYQLQTKDLNYKTVLMSRDSKSFYSTNRLAMSPDGKTIVTGIVKVNNGTGSSVLLYSLDHKFSTLEIPVGNSCSSNGQISDCDDFNVYQVEFSKDGQYIYAFYDYVTKNSDKRQPGMSVIEFHGKDSKTIQTYELDGNTISKDKRTYWGDFSDFLFPPRIGIGETWSASSAADLVSHGATNFINIDGGVLQADGDLDITAYTASLLSNGGTVDTNGNTVTVGSLLGDSTTLNKAGDGSLKVVQNSLSFTKGTISIQGGSLVAMSSNSLGPNSETTVVLSNNGTLGTAAAGVELAKLQVGQGGGTVETIGAGATLASWVEGIGEGKHGSLTKKGLGTFQLQDRPGNTKYTGDLVFLEGTTAISSNEMLGDGNDGALIFDGGTLAVESGVQTFTIPRTITLNANGGTIEVNGESGVILSNLLQGPGGLTKTGDKELAISGVSAYDGPTSIQGGTLTVRGGNALKSTGMVNIASEAIFDVQESQTIGGLSGSGEVTVLAGKILTVGNGDQNSTFDGTFSESTAGGSGSAGVTKVGTGTFVSNGVSDLPHTINAGTWVVGDENSSDARINGLVTVNAGGQLKGRGTIGSGDAEPGLVVQSGGTVAPGNSVGTLNVVGNATLAPGSVYIVEIGPNGTSDQIAATGTVALGGELRLNELDPFELGQRYTIVSAGAVSGQFSNPDLSLPLLTLPIIYADDKKHVYLDAVRNSTPMSSFADTDNEKNTADAIDSLDPKNPLQVAILNLGNKEQIKDALGQASGEVHASAKSALVQDSHFLRDAILGRLRQSFTPGSGPGTPVVTYSEDGQGGQQNHWASSNTEENVFWTQAFGATGQTQSDGNAAKLNQSTMGVFFGTDTRVGEDWRVGGLFGYSTMTLDVHSYHSSAHSDGFHLGAYGGRQWDAWGLRTGLGYSWYDMRVKRSIDFNGYSDSLRNRTKGSTTQLFGELGYQIDQGRFLLEPFFNLAMVYVSTAKLNEDGGAAALREESARSMKTAFSTLGLHGSTHFRLNKLDGLVQGTLGWRHAYGSAIPESNHAFTGSETYKVVEGVPIDKNAAVLELGVDLAASKTVTLGVTYAGQMSGTVQSHSGQFKLGWKF